MLAVFVSSIGKNFNRKSDRRTEAQLQLTTNIIEERYYRSDTLLFKLRLLYTNSGMQPLILYRQSTAIFKEMISRDVKEAEKKKYLKNVSPFIHPVMPKVKDETEPDDRTFVILQPGASHSEETDFYLDLYDGTKETEDFMKWGEYVLQVRVGTWYESKELSLKLGDRWRSIGYLWTKPVISNPMPFKTESLNKRAIVILHLDNWPRSSLNA